MIPRKISVNKTLSDFIILGFFVALSLSSIAESLELKALDIFRKPHNPHPDIVLLAIDDASLQAVGRWPWDRKIYASLLNKLNAVHPRVLAIDINFAESQNAINDSAFREALDHATFPVILAAEAVYSQDTSRPQSILRPIDILTKSKKVSLGHVNVQISKDGLARLSPSVLENKDTEILPISYQMASVIGSELPKESEYFIDFAGPAGTMPTYSVKNLLTGSAGNKNLEDKMIILGATASDLHDYVSAPIAGRLLAGAEWHANVLDNVLQHREIKALGKISSILITAVIGLLLIILLRYFNTRIAVTISLISGLSVFITSWYLWDQKIALPYFSNILLITSLFLSQAFYRWYISEAEKRKLQKTMGHYFSPQVMSYIIEHPEKLKLGGEKKEITVLFSDIRSFTTITENTAPEILSALLHEYFTEMTEEVLATDGVLDKFIGDAIMAFWGAPISQDDQADRALKTAMGMLKRLKKLNESWKERGWLTINGVEWPEIKIGIGIHTGSAIVGNMGSEKRFDYTVIGDTVNVASRLEGLTKEYSVPLIISENSKNKLGSDKSLTPLGSVTVKGKTQALSIYTMEELTK